MFRPVRIRHYLSAMRTRGFSPAQVLMDTSIDESKLNDSTYLIDLPQGCKVVSNMIRLTGNQGIGFEIGSEAEFVDLGIVGYALLSCQNVRDANNLWINYHNALVGMLVSQTLTEIKPDNWYITITHSLPLGFIYNFCVEESLVMAFRLGGMMADQKTVVEKLELSYPAPTHFALYHKYLGCLPQFNAAHTRITYSAPSLDRALRGSDSEFNTLCQQHCSQILQQISGNSPLASQLREFLLRQPGRTPDLNEAAEKFGMTPRTFRRRLNDEGFTYHGLINNFRFDFAKEYLLTTHMTIKEIGYVLGYKDVDIFRRAFKSWTGMTITQYQGSQPQRK